jgi:DNA-binding IclR family transcriptional regulator
VPAEPPLTAPEVAVLNVLLEPTNRVAESTLEGISESAGLNVQHAHRTLQGLERRQPSLVREDIDAGLGIRFWMTTYDAAEAMEEPT